MVKIRKKTSRRQPTRLRERIKHKVSAAHKKGKKAAKNDPTWRSKKRKDPGIPALFPYKDQVLEEIKQAKLQREAERQQRREQHRTQASAAESMQTLAASAATLEDDTAVDGDTLDAEEGVVDASASLRTHARSLRAVLSRSDVIIEVLDARDPQGSRSRAMEKDFLAMPGDKHLVLVLNKVDLVPRENIEGWLTYLRRSFPTLPMKSSTQAQRRNLGSSAVAAHITGAASTSTQPLLKLLKHYGRAPAGVKGKASITVGVVGMPNVGKSSLINTLKRSKACGVAPTPGYTREVQEIALDAGLKILDCPGVVLEGGNDGPEKALRNSLRVEQLEDPVSPVELLIGRCKPSQLMMLYNIPTFQGVQDFLICVARSRGRLKKGGVPDIEGTARSVLRDWNAGRIPYCTPAPALPASSSSLPTVERQSNVVNEDAIVSSFAPAFDIDGLLGEADAAALADSVSASEMKGVVKMNVDETPVDGIEGRAKLMDEESDNETDALFPGPNGVAVSRKRTLGDIEDTVRARGKQVRFADQASPTFSPRDPEAPPVPLAKKVKLQAKKAKKSARRAESALQNGMRTGEDTLEAVSALPAESLDGLNLETDKLTVEDAITEAPYNFAAYFSHSHVANEDSDGEEEL